MKLFYSLLVFCALSTFNTSVKAQWVQTGGPEGGRISDVARVGNQIWSASPSGVYVSNDEGASWQLHEVFVNKNCTDIAAFGDTVIVLFSYAGEYDDEIMTKTSFDGGNSWSGESLVLNGYVSNSYFLKSGSLLLITNLWPDNYYSEDFGLTWQIFTAFDLSQPVASDYGVLADAWNLEFPNGITSHFYFNSSTQTVTNVYESSPSVWDYTLQDSSIFLFVKTLIDTVYYQYIVRTRNLGQSWDTVYAFTPGPQIAGSFGFIGNTIYFNQFSQIQEVTCLKSEDRGDVWTETPCLDSRYFARDNIVFFDDGSVLRGNHLGIFRILPDSDEEIFQNTGIRAKMINQLEVNNGRLFALTDNFNSTPNFYYSNDGGALWTLGDSILVAVVTLTSRGDTLFGLGGNSDDILYRSFDNGITWDTLHLPFSLTTSLSPLSIQFIDNRLFTSMNGRIYYSDDLGLQWVQTEVWPDEVPGVYSYASNKSGFLRVVNNELYTVTNDGNIFKYNPSANNWSFSDQFWSTGANNRNRISNLNNTVVVHGRQTFQYSSDGGQSWVLPAMGGMPVNSVGDAHNPEFMYELNGIWYGSLGVYGIYYTTNQGESWVQMQNPSPFIAFGGITSLNNVLYSGSNASSVWRRSGAFTQFTGNVYHDINNNGIRESNEPGLEGLVISTQPQPFFATSNNEGNYTLNTDAIGDTLRVNLPSVAFSSNPEYYIAGTEYSDRNFGIYAPEGAADLSVSLTNTQVFRPGFETQVVIGIQNNSLSSNQTTLKLILDPDVSYQSATPNILAQNGDTLVWNLAISTPLQAQTITVTLMNNVQATLGDSAHLKAIISPTSDLISSNNVALLSDEFVGSYDPNDKTCLQGSQFDIDDVQAGKALDYVIRFQNTGTYEAENVHIADTLSQKLDIGSFKVISYSHPMHFTLSGNGILDFYFDNIQLPDSGTNQLLSNGFVRYTIQCKPELTLGNAILNTAAIYFDFNPPIITNTTSTLIVNEVTLPIEVLSSEENLGILVYPNPAIDLLYFELSEEQTGTLELAVFDLAGKQVQSTRLESAKTPVSIGSLSPGLYFGHLIKNGKRLGYFKFVKM